MQRILVWDLPVRAFHWLLVLLVSIAWLTGGTDYTAVHSWTGYSILTLIVFRVMWGVAGSDNARFSDFIRKPSLVFVYLNDLRKGTAAPYVGHNPAGGWMVVVLLVSLLVQAGTGLFTNDDVLFDAPFAAVVGSQWSAWLTDIHKANFNILMALIAVHVAAVAWHEWQGERLVKAMWHGYKISRGQASHVRPLWLALLMLVSAAGGVWWLLSLAPSSLSNF